MIRTAVFVTAAAVCAAAAGPTDRWPEFRGPTGVGLVAEAAMPVKWDATHHVAWKQAVPGAGWSSPLVEGGRVYLTSAVPVPDGGGDLRLEALCLDAATGKLVWEREVFRQEAATAPPIHGKNSHASPTPLVADGRLYVHFGHQGTACLDLAGNVQWRNQEFRYNPVHGNGGSPVLVDDLLIFSCDGGDEAFVVALDRRTGKVRWKTERSVEAEKKFSFGTPLLITVNGRRLLISPGSNMVGAYDPASGREVWRVRYEGYSVIPRPVYGRGLVFICTGYGTPNLLAIRPDGEGDVTDTHVAWTTRRAVPHAPSPLLVGDDLYLVSDRGVASCLDARSGRVHWQQGIGGNYSASPVHAGGKVYFQSEEGVGTVVRAGHRFERLARNPLGERTLASYAAVGRAWLIRTAEHLYRIE